MILYLFIWLFQPWSTVFWTNAEMMMSCAALFYVLAPWLASAATLYMVLLCWCETKRIAFVKVYSPQFSLITPGIRVLNYLHQRTPHSHFLQDPRLLGKQAPHMSPAMTVFTVKDFDLYFHPSTAFIPLHTLCDTHPHVQPPPPFSNHCSLCLKRGESP